jgi:hypothetical protein
MTSTRLLMTLSAAALAVLGVVASFMPQEILGRAGTPADRFTVTLIQLGGALYFGFAILNWTAKGTLLGGIYGRPIVLANFTHFVIGAIVLLEGREPRAAALIVAATFYAVFAVWFGYVLFGRGPASSRA